MSVNRDSFPMFDRLSTTLYRIECRLEHRLSHQMTPHFDIKTPTIIGLDQDSSSAWWVRAFTRVPLIQ